MTRMLTPTHTGWESWCACAHSQEPPRCRAPCCLLWKVGGEIGALAAVQALEGHKLAGPDENASRGPLCCERPAWPGRFEGCTTGSMPTHNATLWPRMELNLVVWWKSVIECFSFRTRSVFFKMFRIDTPYLTREDEQWCFCDFRICFTLRNSSWCYIPYHVILNRFISEADCISNNFVQLNLNTMRAIITQSIFS